MPEVAQEPPAVSLDARWRAMTREQRYITLSWAGVPFESAELLTEIENLNAFHAPRREAIEGVMRGERSRAPGMTPGEIRAAGIHPYDVEGYAG